MTVGQESFLAWPGRKLRGTLPLCAAFALLFLVCYGGASLWTSRLTDLPVWDLPFESRIPFMPSLAVVYLTITPALLLAPFVFRSRSELLPLAATLSLETVVATGFFLVFPQATSFSRPSVDGLTGLFFNLANALNLEHNQFPSLHVAFACTVGWAYARRSPSFGRRAWVAWSLAVAFSTWLMHEHHLVDIAGGAALAAAGMLFVYPWLERADTRSALWAELCCLEQCARFSLRHRRYFVIFLAIWGPSLARWRATRVVRVAFCTAQWIDDLLDGDRESAREPLEVVDELLVSMVRREFSADPLSRLTGILFDELDAFRSGNDDPHADFIALVREMRIDRERVLAGAVWDGDQIATHLRRTFELSVNLMLVATRCNARASDVPVLIEVLGWCSVFRDLEDDVRHGLVNVPRAVWSSVEAAGNSPTTAELDASEAFRAWASASQSDAEKLLPVAGREVEALDDARAQRLLSTFHRSIARFAVRRRERVGNAGRVAALGRGRTGPLAIPAIWKAESPSVATYHDRRPPDPPKAERA